MALTHDVSHEQRDAHGRWVQGVGALKDLILDLRRAGKITDAQRREAMQGLNMHSASGKGLPADAVSRTQQLQHVAATLRYESRKARKEGDIHRSRVHSRPARAIENVIAAHTGTERQLTKTAKVTVAAKAADKPTPPGTLTQAALPKESPEFIERANKVRDFIADSWVDGHSRIPSDRLEAIGAEVQALADLANVSGEIAEFDEQKQRLTSEIAQASQDEKDAKAITYKPGHSISEDQHSWDMWVASQRRTNKLKQDYTKLMFEGDRANQARLLRALKAVRPRFGTGSLDTAGDHIFDENPQRFIPQEWANASNTYPPKLTFVKRRAYYKSGDRSIRARQDNSGSQLHELMHHIERMNPQVLRAEQDYWRKRITNPDGTVQPKVQLNTMPPYKGMGYNNHEWVVPDGWADAYVGKVYNGQSFELLSMGMEDMWYPKGYADPNHRQWVTGVMAAL